MAGKPSILLIDDGELDDLRALLDEIGASYVWLSGREVPGEIENPEDLFITTASRAVSLLYLGGAQRKPRRPVRIAVGTGSTNTQRAAIKRAGFDFLVRRPVHPTAMRLLLLHALYRGKERRGATRYAFGYDVSYRIRFRRRRAVLAELSAEGCRLITEQFPEPGTMTSVQLPAEVAGGRPLDLRGRIVRGQRIDRPNGPVMIGIRFEDLDANALDRLRKVLLERYWGPAMMPAAIAGSKGSGQTAAPRQRGQSRPQADPETRAQARTEVQTPSAPRTRTEPAAEPQPRAETRSPESSPRVEGARDPEHEPPTVSVPEEPPIVEPGEPTFPSTDVSPNPAPRRKNPRVTYGGEVIAMADAVSRVLIGRDLSCEGMRVDRHPKLHVGDHVRLAVYASGHEDPFLIGASVARDDGASGLALRFEEMSSEAEERLRELLESLPPIESIGSTDDRPVIFSEVVPSG